jgi:hypothetical protein
VLQLAFPGEGRTPGVHAVIDVYGIAYIPEDLAERQIASGVCVPTFVSGLLLIYVFYYLLGLAPDPTARVDIFASLPPSRTGFLLIDFLLAGDFPDRDIRIGADGDRALARMQVVDL